jgi:hypothetical protein
MKIVAADGQETEINTVDELLSHIPDDVQNSLKSQRNITESDFREYLETFVDQNRTVKSDNLVRDVSAAVPIFQQEDRLPARGWDPVMFHYLYPDAHVRGGTNSAIYQRTQDAIRQAQSMRMNGYMMLAYYSDWANFFLGNRDVVASLLSGGANVGSDDKLIGLANEALRGSHLEKPDLMKGALNDLPSTQERFIIPFDYGIHRTYLGISHKGAAYRLEYFDRQRQTLTLKDKQIPGYLNGDDMSHSRPIYFTFSRGSAALASTWEAARKIAQGAAGNDLGSEERRKVLETLAASAEEIGEFGTVEPAQHPLALHCAWASLESIIRTRIGPQDLQSQVDFMRKVVVNRFTAARGTAEEKAAVGLM